ncbi:MAG: hypothetical protein Q9172_004580 [Xanthocarpia lactea]
MVDCDQVKEKVEKKVMEKVEKKVNEEKKPETEMLLTSLQILNVATAAVTDTFTTATTVTIVE